MRSTLAVLFVGTLFVTAGCQGLFGPSQPPSDERAVAALDRAQAAAADVTSYRFSVDGRVEATSDGERLSRDVTGSGAVNVGERRMNATVRTRDGARSTYIHGYTVDTECSRIGWTRRNLTRSTRWLNYTALGQQLALLDRTNVYWEGTGSVDGTETAVVSASPTERDFRAVADAQGTGDGDPGSANIENATVTVWISRETGRVLQAHREVRVGSGGSTATASVTFRFHDYGDPVTVTRPSFGQESARWKTGCPGS